MQQALIHLQAFAKKFNLAHLKFNVDRLDIYKLKNVLFEAISKLK